MQLQLTPLDESALSPAVCKVASAAAPAQVRMMAARGMAPLPPQDLAIALFQIAVTSDGTLKEAAEKSARELPDAVLASALGGALDPRVLDFFARALVQRETALQVVLLNTATADETFAALAGLGRGALLDQIAQNERRLLRHPAIIAALYLNPRTRMSTAQRALELAIRNGVHVEGISAFEEVKAAIESEGAAVDDAMDAVFAGVVEAAGVQQGAALAAPLDEAARPEAEASAEAAHQAAEQAALGQSTPGFGDLTRLSKLSMAAKLRLAALGNALVRALLVRDSSRLVALAAVRHPGVNEFEAERFAANRALHEDVIRYIASQRQFTKRYSVKLNLVNNPKCPLQVSMTFLGHLTPRDLRIVARSKGIPSALARAAQGLVAKREAR